MKEIGIYVHIPFCEKKCYYCDFCSFENKDDLIIRYIKCLIRELIEESRPEYYVKTIFIGGGTPSYIDEFYIEQIINTINEYYQIDKNIEVTIEANPGTINKEKLEKYFSYGINRLSIGLQTSNNNILKEIGRIHTFEQYKETISLAKEVGFTNINSDIIIGLPEQTIYDVENTIDSLLEQDLQHISIYSLIIEEGTALEKKLSANQIKLPDEEIERYMYWFAKRKLERNGFVHYEISNFAKPGYMANHNLNCWNQEEYLGFGIDAASYSNKRRYKNIKNLEQYIENIEADKLEKNRIIEENQTIEEQMKEYMILGLRMIKGISINGFRKKFEKSPLTVFEKQIKNLVKDNLIDLDVNSIKLSKKGLDLANVVWEEFI